MLAAAAISGGAACAALAASNDDAGSAWKAKQPIRLVVPFSAGGGSDVAARLLAQGLGNSLGEPMVVENKPGASGAIASDYVYMAAPDGYTLLLGTADTQAMNPHVNKVRYDSLRYVPVAAIAKVSYALVGRLDMPAADTHALVALAKTRSLTYGSSGTGAAADVQMRMFDGVAKITNMLHVPYQGVAPAFQALVAGQVDLAMIPVALVAQYRSKVKIYGIASLQRNPAIADVPTLAEQGFPVDGDPWVGLLAPPKTPDAVASAIAERVAKVLAVPENQQKLRDVGMTPYQGTRSEFAAFYRKDYEKWEKAIKSAGITVQ
jgi:tripartite-type tricarboxylate transporter receptor subunit TctC